MSLLLGLSAFVFGCSVPIQLSESEARDVERAVLKSFEGLVSAAQDLDFDRYLEYFDGERFSGLNEMEPSPIPSENSMTSTGTFFHYPSSMSH